MIADTSIHLEVNPEMKQGVRADQVTKVEDRKSAMADSRRRPDSSSP
jgi:hypothetical protein